MSGVQRMTRRTQLAQKRSDTGVASQRGIAGEFKGRGTREFDIESPRSEAPTMASRRLLLLAAAILAAWVPPASAQTITEFPLPSAGSNPNGITAGPDGNLWFTE
jgi:hypothetical protein